MIHPKKFIEPDPLLSNHYIPDPDSVKRKHAVWIIISYVPDKNSGCECMTHSINKFLIEKGWTISVITPKHSLSEYEGVSIIKFGEKKKIEKAIRESTLILSYLHYQTMVAELAKKAQKPYIAVHHNSFQIPYIRDILHIYPAKNFYIINNSHWLDTFYMKSLARIPDNNVQEFSSIYGSHSIVVYPPVDYHDFQFPVKGNKVTLVNCSAEKGGSILIALAKAMPDVEFLGVVGTYNKQILDKSLPNITYMDNTPNVKEFYEQTKIIIMPSVYESWGRVAVEAMSLGIPVIANPTPGLRESLGEAGIYVNREHLGGWIYAIRNLLNNPWFYSRKSMEGKIRAKELDPKPQLYHLEQWLNNIDWK